MVSAKSRASIGGFSVKLPEYLRHENEIQTQKIALRQFQRFS